LIKAKLPDGEPLVKGKKITGFSDLEDPHHPWESWIDCPPFTADTISYNAAWLPEDTTARKVLYL
jgi:hypothetical protein